MSSLPQPPTLALLGRVEDEFRAISSRVASGGGHDASGQAALGSILDALRGRAFAELQRRLGAAGAGEDEDGEAMGGAGGGAHAAAADEDVEPLDRSLAERRVAAEKASAALARQVAAARAQHFKAIPSSIRETLTRRSDEVLDAIGTGAGASSGGGAGKSGGGGRRASTAAAKATAAIWSPASSSSSSSAAIAGAKEGEIKVNFPLAFENSKAILMDAAVEMASKVAELDQVTLDSHDTLQAMTKSKHRGPKAQNLEKLLTTSRGGGHGGGAR